MPGCPSCGEQNPERARFCLACGTPLSTEAPRRESRKTVTVLFCDMADSTVLGERVDPESMRRVSSRYFDEMRAVLERHGGTVEKFIGDAVMAVFGTPTVHEDDALRAVRAAAEMREALTALNGELSRDWGIELSIRIGLNTGEVVAGHASDGHTLVTGDAVNVASRLEGAARSGEILIGDPTYRLVRDAVVAEPLEGLELKGKERPVAAWRLIAVIAGAPSPARRTESPLVGRERELALLVQALDRATVDRTCHLFTLLGPAGVGKSRLVAELASTSEHQATVLPGRCLPYGEGITFWPIVEVVKRAAGITPRLTTAEVEERLRSVLHADRRGDEIAERLGALLGATETRVSSADTFWAVRKLLEAVARDRPLVVVLDDVQWGEETFLDLVEHVADWTRDAPILIVCLARPELLEERPGWGGGKLNSTSLLLEPLDDEACSRLIDNLLESDAGAGLKERIARAAEGNPLFVEEMLSMLIDEGTLRRENGGWVPVGDVASIDVPPTIQALLAARLDRLSGDERTVLEHAAVAGKLFSRGALRTLAGAGAPAALDDQLESLVRKQLIQPHQAVFAGEDTFRFRHALIRDAAYQTMPKDMRAELHDRFGTWLEERAGGSGPEIEEIIGYHFEQAHRFRAELHGGDDRARALARRAATHLASAGRKAFGRNDMPAAVSLLTRATILLRDDDELWIELAPDLGKALRETGEIARADGVLTRAIENAAAAGNRGAESLAQIERAMLLRQGDPTRDGADVRHTAETAIAVFEELGDRLGIARALELVAFEHWLQCRYEAMEGVLEEALEHARAAGDRREVASILNALARAALLGPRPVEEALRRCEEMRAEAGDDRNLDAVLDAIVAVLEAQLGHFAAARELCVRSRESFEDLGLDLQLVSLHAYSGLVELLAGDPAAAEHELSQGYQGLERMGEKGRLSTMTAFLARAHYEQGNLDEAERYTRITESSASPDDVVSQAVWRQTRARVLAARGEPKQALELARDAVSLADETDYVILRGDALLALAEVHGAAGKGSEANDSSAEALRLYEAKGDIVSAARARAFSAAQLDRARVKQ